MNYKISPKGSSRLLIGNILLLILLWQGLKIIKAEEKEVSSKSTLATPFSTSSLGSTGISKSTLGMLKNATLFDLPFKVDKEDILVETLRFMSSLMNPDANPCDDFYEYACGNWKNSDRVPKESQSTTFLSAILNKMEKFMIEQMKNITKENDKMLLSKRFFAACLKDFNNLKLGIDSLLLEEQTLYDKIKNVNGTKWIQLNFMSPYNIYPLLPFYFHFCRVNRRSEILIKLPRSTVQNQLLEQDFAKLFDDKKSELMQMVEFEKNLTSSVKPRLRDEYMTVGKFLEIHAKDTINWTAVFETVFHSKVNTEWLIGNEIADFVDMEQVLRRTNPDVLRNYVKWSTIIYFYDLWTEKAEEDPRYEKICLRQTEKYFPNNILPLLLKNLYNDIRKEDLLRMILHLQREFDNIIQRSSLGDPRSKYLAKRKIHSLDFLVGFTQEMILNSTAPYSEENITATSNYFKNLQLVESFNAAQDRESVGLTVKEKVYMPYSVNAYYVHSVHKVSIPIGVSQMPLYHITFPNSLKYAGIGFMIAHEMAHAHDVKETDSIKRTWYTENSKEDYWERYRCFIDEYNDFVFQGLSMNISLTIFDNIADNVASHIAYQTYMKNSGHVSGYKIPILNMTDTQVFFLKMAQSWCTGHDSTYKANHIRQIAHTYPDFRVKGILRNMPEFSEAFDCRLGSEMNPLKKCSIW